MLRRRELMVGKSELPAGYKRCSYLCGNGKRKSSAYAYIDTGIYDSSLVAYEISIQIFTNIDYERFVGAIGSWQMRNTDYNYTEFLIKLIGDNGYSQTVGKFTPPSSKFLYCANGGSVSIDGISVFKNTKTYETTYSIWLFGVNRGDRGTDAKIYGTKMWENGVLVRDYIPCIDKTCRPCMYDLVSKQPFYSQGTGEFGYELMDGTYVAPI